jgi:hypothetical protein
MPARVTTFFGSITDDGTQTFLNGIAASAVLTPYGQAGGLGEIGSAGPASLTIADHRG